MKIEQGTSLSNIFGAVDEAAAHASQVAKAAAEHATAGTPTTAGNVEEHDSALKIYGNFCGPGWGDETRMPVDAIDAACQKHDQGYGKNGYFDVGTDLGLLGRLTELQFTGDLSLKQRLTAAGIEVGFGLSAFPISLTKAAIEKTVPGAATLENAAVDAAESVGNKAAEVASEVASGAKHVASEVASDVKDAASKAAKGAEAVGKSVLHHINPFG